MEGGLDLRGLDRERGRNREGEDQVIHRHSMVQMSQALQRALAAQNGNINEQNYSSQAAFNRMAINQN